MYANLQGAPVFIYVQIPTVVWKRASFLSFFLSFSVGLSVGLGG